MADPVRCSWCSAEVATEDTHCPSCGAALRMTETAATLKIPGLTVMDPALEAWAAQPLHLPTASPSQALAGGAVSAAVQGGPAGIVALGALGAVAAAEYLSAGAGGGAGTDPERVGELPPYVQDALHRLDGGPDPTPPSDPNAA